MSTDNKDGIAHMQTWIFCMAQERLNKTPLEVSEIFRKHNVFHFIEANFDEFHLNSYSLAFDEVVRYLKSEGVEV